ncbi:MAG: integration host factor subunit beta [Flavobacteriales bacterium TMED113]|nr:MAG: integration host factor subunit beta [Flavobacteriales bacterium TMED113]
MTKLDLIKKIASSTGLERGEVSVVIENLMFEIKDSISNKNSVYLRGFGTFLAKKKAKKMGRNITKNTAILIPEHFAPSFKPSKSFINKVKKK